MRTPRVFLQQIVSPGERVELPAPEARHLIRVLRRAPGDAVEVLTEDGHAFEGRILELSGGGRVVVEITGERRGEGGAADGPPRLAITLGLAVVKGQAFDLALRMAAELGIDTVVPLFTSRTIVRWDAPSEKRRRYERIAREAGKQSGRVKPLRVLDGAPFSAWIESSPRAGAGASVRRWIAAPGAPLPEGPGDLERAPSEVVFAVGPEGGFTEAELEAALSSGWSLCGFPTPVLRTPTAVALIAALGLLWRSG